MSKKAVEKEKIKIKDELGEQQARWADVKYENQKYLKDSEVVLDGATFSKLLNATSGYAKAMMDTKNLLKDVYEYYTRLEASIHEIQVKLADIHCDNVDAGLTETIVKEDGK